MDKRLRLVLLGTFLLLLLQAGQLLIIAERNLGNSTSNGAFTFAFVCLFFIPTSLILTGAVMWLLRGSRQEHKPLYLLGLINILLALQLSWFAVDPCSWAMILGLHLSGC
jgi:hypothetical protein